MANLDSLIRVTDELYNEICSDGQVKEWRKFYQAIPIKLNRIRVYSQLSSYPGVVSAYNHRNLPGALKQQILKKHGEPKEDEWTYENYEAIYAKGNIEDGRIFIMDGRKTFYSEVRLLISPMAVELTEAIEHLQNDKESIEYGCIVENVEDEPSRFLKITLEIPKTEFQNIFSALRSPNNDPFSLICSVEVFVLTLMPIKAPSEQELEEDKIYYIDDLYGPKQAFLGSIVMERNIGKES